MSIGVATGRLSRRTCERRDGIQHLDRVLIVTDFEWLRREDAAPAESARFKPGHTRLEAGLGGGSALLVRELGLGSKCLCVHGMCEYDQKRIKRDYRFEFGG